MKLQEAFVILMKTMCHIDLLYVFVPESLPTNLQIQKTELGVHALKPNHTVPTQEGNWQIQSPWNHCKAESKRSNENISLQPVC